MVWLKDTSKYEKWLHKNGSYTSKNPKSFVFVCVGGACSCICLSLHQCIHRTVVQLVLMLIIDHASSHRVPHYVPIMLPQVVARPLMQITSLEGTVIYSRLQPTIPSFRRVTRKLFVIESIFCPLFPLNFCLHRPLATPHLYVATTPQKTKNIIYEVFFTLKSGSEWRCSQNYTLYRFAFCPISQVSKHPQLQHVWKKPRVARPLHTLFFRFCLTKLNVDTTPLWAFH